VEDVICRYLIPALCDGRGCSDAERDLLALPIKFGGMGIVNIANTSTNEYETSSKLTNGLKERIVELPSGC